MKKLQEIKLGLFFWWFDVKCEIDNIWRRIWNKRFLLWWYRLWIRKDEFHISLQGDLSALLVMTPHEQNKYYTDLYRRRRIAHERNNNRP
jgi:hypothetical protein